MIDQKNPIESLSFDSMSPRYSFGLSRVEGLRLWARLLVISPKKWQTKVEGITSSAIHFLNKDRMCFLKSLSKIGNVDLQVIPVDRHPARDALNFQEKMRKLEEQYGICPCSLLDPLLILAREDIPYGQCWLVLTDHGVMNINGRIRWLLLKRDFYGDALTTCGSPDMDLDSEFGLLVRRVARP